MPINPAFTTGGQSLFSGFGGGAASGAGAAGGGAAGIAGMPWSMIVPILLSVFGGLFEKKEDPVANALELKQQMASLGMDPPFQNQYLPQMSEAAMRAVMGQLGRTQNWGWPEGKGLDTSWIQDMMAKLPAGTPLEQRLERRSR